MNLQLARLDGVDPADIIALMSHRSARRHMPLAEGAAICARVLDEALGTFGFDSVTILLPPTQRSGHGVRLGFRADGETTVEGQRFLRFRLHSADRPPA